MLSSREQCLYERLECRCERFDDVEPLTAMLCSRGQCLYERRECRCERFDHVEPLTARLSSQGECLYERLECRCERFDDVEPLTARLSSQGECLRQRPACLYERPEHRGAKTEGGALLFQRLSPSPEVPGDEGASLCLNAEGLTPLRSAVLRRPAPLHQGQGAREETVERRVARHDRREVDRRTRTLLTETLGSIEQDPSPPTQADAPQRYAGGMVAASKGSAVSPSSPPNVPTSAYPSAP